MTNLVHIRGVISISFISPVADRVRVWEVSSLFFAPSPGGESDTPPLRLSRERISSAETCQICFGLRSGKFPCHVLISYPKMLESAILDGKSKRQRSLGTRKEPLGTGGIGLYGFPNLDEKLWGSVGATPTSVAVEL